MMPAHSCTQGDTLAVHRSKTNSRKIKYKDEETRQPGKRFSVSCMCTLCLWRSRNVKWKLLVNICAGSWECCTETLVKTIISLNRRSLGVTVGPRCHFFFNSNANGTSNYLMDTIKMCQTLRNTLKSPARDMACQPPARLPAAARFNLPFRGVKEGSAD